MLILCKSGAMSVNTLAGKKWTRYDSDKHSISLVCWGFFFVYLLLFLIKIPLRREKGFVLFCKIYNCVLVGSQLLLTVWYSFIIIWTCIGGLFWAKYIISLRPINLLRTLKFSLDHANFPEANPWQFFSLLD